jgi:FMN phosphatase YigB (HAD superfamily)
MKNITVAFDCDGTLIQNSPAGSREHQIVANERIRTLLIILSSFKNVEIWVWSGGGELWARQVAAAIGVDAYVDKFLSKNMLLERDADGHPQFAPDTQPDIAIDDIQSCELGMLNLIVREK